ncbi:MAG: tetratricopeptide repeat protein [Saprospiraceae bacterium]|nr:tetratricopeptide repeat protein [Saprospiraceae bacterium]
MRYFLILSSVLLLDSILCAQDSYKAYLSLSYEAIDSVADLNYSQGDYKKCLYLMQAGSHKAAADFGKKDSIFAEYTSNIGFFHKKLGNYEKALPFYLEAKEINKEVLGTDHVNYAKSLNNIANLYQAKGENEKALPLLIESKDIRKKVLGTNSLKYAQSLNNIARHYIAMGDYEKAIEVFIQSKEIYERNPKLQNKYFAITLANLASTYQTIGKFEEAISLNLRAKRIYEKELGTNHPTYINNLNNMATLYADMGNTEQAINLFKEAKDGYEKILGKDHIYVAKVLSNLAQSYMATKNYEKARSLFIQSKDIREKALGKYHPEFAKALTYLAELYNQNQNYTAAMPLIVEATEIYKKVLGADHTDYAESLSKLATVYQAVGESDKALPLLLETQQIFQKAFGKGHSSYVKAQINIANWYSNQKDYTKAKLYLQEAIEKSTGLPVSLNISHAWADSLKNADYKSVLNLERMIEALSLLYDLPKVASHSINQQEQLIVADLIMELLEKLKNQLLNENDKLRILTTSDEWFQKSLKLLTPNKDNERAFELSDQNKSVLLLEATKSEEAYRLGELPDSLIRQDKKLRKKQSQLQAQLQEIRSKKEKQQLRNILNKTNEDINKLDLYIKKQYPKYDQLKYQHQRIKITEIQQLLDEQTVLVEYVISDSILHIFCIDQKEVQWKQQYILTEDLEQHIQQLRKGLSDYDFIKNKKEEAYLAFTTEAYWFYQKLIVPILSDKPEIKNLIIVSDGKLGHLPFEVFLTEAAPETSIDYSTLAYLLKDYKISYNYSCKLWQENVNTQSVDNNGEILGMAAAYKSVDTSLLQLRLVTDVLLRNRLQPLPSAKEEIQELEQHFKGFFAYDSLASEQNVKALAPQYAVIHLAMHGILNSQRPVLSSLVFSEDGDSSESNFWQAHEISKSKLNANLVVLSACETGYGKFQKGNGIASLARAFMYAGASALVVSLWQVNDKSTAMIMKQFYKNLANKMPKDEALQKAKLDYIASVDKLVAHPAYWSSFIQIGNIESINLKQKNDGQNYTYWWIMLAALLAVLTGIFFSRR